MLCLKASATEKKQIISKIIDVPKYEKRVFWNIQFKFLNDLYKLYPDFYFWKLLRFNKKFESINYFFCEHGKEILHKKFMEYSYIIPEKNKIIIGKKCGKDYTSKKKPSTIRDFLNYE